MKYVINKLSKEEFNDIRKIRSKPEILPEDFYYENKRHFFYSCRKIILNKTSINIEALEPTLKEFCHLLFDFTVDNIEEICMKKLNYPTTCYVTFLSNSFDDESLLKSLKSVKNIIDDYKYMLSKSREDFINDKYFRVYIDINKNTDVKVKNYILNTKFCFEDKEIDEKLIESKLVDLEKKSGLYKLYDEKKNLIFIGKSYNLAERIMQSIKNHKASYFSYSVIENKADTDIYAIYYISKLNPILNINARYTDVSTLKIEEIEFVKPIYIFKQDIDRAIVEIDNNNLERLKVINRGGKI